ncbi:DUF885 domain-containing protein [Haliangium sp.]|uniref:DUF885 domain-containing protein n=1 Tax=Haliangium sp. TaxID=2663208 RepID=UPI003D1255C5
MTRRKKITLAVLGTVLGAGLVFAIPTIWGKPWSIQHFYGRVFLEFALDHPMLLSRLRVLEGVGLTFHNDDLDDLSVAATERSQAMVRDSLATLRSYDRDGLDDPLSYDVMEWFLADQAAGERFAFHTYPVNQMSGIQSDLPDFMINGHRVDDVEGAEDYVTRVSKLGVAIDQVIEGLRYREERGVAPPRFVMTRVLAEMRDFVAPAAREHVLYTHFAEATEELEGLDPDDRKALLDALAGHIEDRVYPAYQRLIDFFAERELSASTDDGVWKLPDGAEFYAWRLRAFTTTELSAEEIHQLGLREVARIQGEMKDILRAEGYDPVDFGATMQALNREPRFLYPDTDDGRAQILADYQAIIDEVDAGIDHLFSLRPEVGVKVERVPTFKEATAPGAYYQAAPMDGSAPGVFFANLRSVEEIPRFGMRTLAYHEAIPGHHFQIAIAQSRTDLPFFRRILPFTAYTEGWALYAERVAAENGFLPTPYDRLGYLTAELFRAVRLVVDTGIHHHRWSRERAIEYMLANTGMPETDVVAEIERYIVFPGQACAYKIGQLEILALREQARAALGERFDLQRFHDVVLGNGALPLTLLRRVVEDWIASEQAKGA